MTNIVSTYFNYSIRQFGCTQYMYHVLEVNIIQVCVYICTWPLYKYAKNIDPRLSLILLQKFARSIFGGFQKNKSKSL